MGLPPHKREIAVARVERRALKVRVHRCGCRQLQEGVFYLCGYGSGRGPFGAAHAPGQIRDKRGTLRG
jgi:hypothetical protein